MAWSSRTRDVIEWDGTIRAKKFEGGGLGGGADNLGNHTATQTLSGSNLFMSGDINIDGTLYPTTGIDIFQGAGDPDMEINVDTSPINRGYIQVQNNDPLWIIVNNKISPISFLISFHYFINAVSLTSIKQPKSFFNSSVL